MESQLTSAIRTVEQAGEHGHFPHPGWASFSGTDFLDDLKGFFVNDSLMGIFKDFPLIGAVVDRLVMLIRFHMGLEIHRMPQIIHPVQYLCNYRPIPCEFVRWECSSRLFAFLQYVIGGAEDFSFRQDIGYPRRTITLHAQTEDFTNYFGGFFVYNPLLFVFRVLHVAVWGMGADMLTGHSL